MPAPKPKPAFPFVRTTVHDLRNSLTGVRGYLDLLQRAVDRGDAAKAAEYAAAARHACGDTEGLLNLLGELNRLSAGVARVDLERIDLGVALPGWIEAWRSDTGGRARWRPPAAKAPARAHGDPRLLEKVVVALLDDARRAAADDGGAEVELVAEGETAAVRFSDGAAFPAWMVVTDLHDLLAVGAEVERDRAGAPPASQIVVPFCALAMQIMGGEFRAAPRPRGGREFTLRLPA